jgi:hypothetical protein
VRRALLTAALVATALVSLVPADAAERVDYASFARNVLPPGQSGSLAFPPTATDQLALYDGLTPKRGNVTAADLNRYFKSARFGPDGRVVRTVRPRPGLVIRRDRWEVPHVTGRTRSDVMFGAGWVTAEDRGLLMNLLRGPGRVAALDVPGLDARSRSRTAPPPSRPPPRRRPGWRRRSRSSAPGARAGGASSPTSTRTSPGSTPSTPGRATGSVRGRGTT